MQLNAVRTLTVRGQSQGLDKVKADLGGVSDAQEKVTQTSEAMARTTETTARRQLSAGREFQRLVERNDRLVYLQTQLGKEMSVVNRAFEQGAVDAQRHAQAVQMVETKYRGLVSAEERARAASQSLSAATDQQATSLNRLAAANDNARGSTANIAAQFQDIGVTAAMGMSPLMIALQQGTQLSAVLNTMQNPIKGLGIALMSILNPISLLTIGFIALAAVAIQWFMGSEEQASKATSALEKHSEWLDKLLKGYDAVRDAAQKAADAAARLPEGVVASDLQTSLKAQEAAMRSLGERAEELQVKFAAAVGILKGEDAFRVNNGGEAMLADVIQQVEALRNLGITANSTAEEIDAASVAARELYNSTDDAGVRDFANEMFQLTVELRNTQAVIDSTVVSISTLKMQDLSNMQSWGMIARDTSLGLSMVERAALAAAWAIANSGGAAVVAAGQYGTATGAANAYANAMFRLGSLIPQVAAAQAQFGQLKQAESDYSMAISENKNLLDKRGISLDEFSRRQEAANSLYQRAQDQVTGLTDATVQLEQAERQAAIGGMSAQDAAAAQITDRYKGLEKQLADSGAGQEEFTRLTTAMNAELNNSATSFAETAAKAGGAGGGIGAAGAAAKAAEKEFNTLASTADGLAEKLFPGEYARREAEELSAALAQYGNSLDTFQRQAVEARIGDQFKAAGLNVRELEDTTKDAGKNMADSLQSTLGSVLQDLFSSPIKDFDDFLDRVLSGFAQLGQQNLSNLFGGGSTSAASGGADPMSVLAGAVQDGAEAGTAKGAFGGIFDGFDSIFGGKAGSGAKGMSAMASAGLGGFGMGYETQNPLMGAIGGAMQGFSAGAALGGAGGPIGAVIGGLAGFIGAMMGAAKAAKEAREKFAKLKTDIDNLLDIGEGRGVGEMTKTFRDFYKKSYELQEEANKGQDMAIKKRLQDAVNSFFGFLNTDFALSFEGTIDALKGGEGLKGAFVSAQKEIIGMREELKGFVADAQFMNEKFGELAMIDWTKETAAAVAEARKATQAYALTVLAGAHELTEFEEGVAQANGRASALQVTLEQLGMSATDAAGAITGALNMALAKLKDEYLADVNSSINDLSGFGWLNDISEAQKTYQDRMRDSAALGLDGSLALRELNLSLADIVQGAGLSADTLAMLGDAFPMLAGLLDTIAGKDAMATVADARAELQRAYDAEANAIKDLISRTERFIETIKTFRDGMRLDASSPLGPEQKLLEAQRQYRETLALANTGDEAAMGRLTDVSQAYLDEARAYYASTDQYVAIWEEVDRTLAATQGNAVTQLDVARSQLDALNASVAGILDLNVNVKTVAEAMMGFMGAQAASDAALKAQIAAMANAGANTVQELYKSVLGRSGSEAEIGWWTASGKSMSQIEKDIVWAKQHGAMADGGIVGRFQAGGMVGNGVYDVDSVLARYAGGGNIALAGGEHVTRATSVNAGTMSTLNHINRTGTVPGNDNGDVVAELRALRQDNANLTSAVSRLAAAVGYSDEETRGLIRRGNEIQEDTSSMLKRVVSR